MRKWIVILFVVLGVGGTWRGVEGQTREDSAAVLLGAARRLDAEGNRVAARAVLDLVGRQYEGTAAAVEAMALLRSFGARVAGEESGRVELTVWGTAYGVWLGVATPLMLSSEEPAAYGVGLLTGAPLGFLVSRAYIKSHPGITVGQSRALTFGGTWGTWQGAGWMLVLGDRHYQACLEFDYCDVDVDPSTEKTLAAMVAGGLAGIGTGAILARKPINAGVAATVSSSGLWGTWFGVALGLIADAEDDNLLAATLIGGDAAVVTAGLLAPKWNPSVNRVRLISLAGLVGGVAGGGLLLILQPEDAQTAVTIPLVTSVGGLVFGAYATRDYDRNRVGGGQREGNALLQWNDGWKVGALEPVPTLRRDMRGAKTRLEPALFVNLFSARF